MLKKLLFVLPIFLSFNSKAQVDSLLLDLFDDKNEVNYATASFKTTRIVNGQSIENTHEGTLDFKISHRFGFLSSGLYELFGLDQATIRLGLDYGITDKLMIGFGRTSVEKALDGFVKYKILRQSKGAKKMPLTLSAFSSVAAQTLRWDDSERTNLFSSRLYYTYQIIAGRKFSESTSLQLMPTLVHRNLVTKKIEKNDVYALGIAGRQKLSKRLALNFEYYYLLPDQVLDIYHNSLSFGLDIETGGHVFQLHCTNSTSMIEKGFITETTGNWVDGDIRFGFNVSRVFTLKGKKKPKNL
jgi:Membrane bound beta barrel domain (DUF5777)